MFGLKSDLQTPSLSLQCVRKNLEKYCVNRDLFGDITFELDDGNTKAHRAILVARCEVMRAMLNGGFREAHANTVHFADVYISTVLINLLCAYRLYCPVLLNTRSISCYATSTRMKYPRYLPINVSTCSN